MSTKTPMPSGRSKAEPVTLVILGASGDLTRRKLVPALFALSESGLLPEAFRIVAFARRDYSSEVFRDMMRAALREHSRVLVRDNRLNDFVSRIDYHRGLLDQLDSYVELQTNLQDERYPDNRLFYLATRPKLFGPCVRFLTESGLAVKGAHQPWQRVVVEKPFGRDLPSAQQLNLDLLTCLDEHQLFRIDHYLGKETVQNLLSFRFANSVFEALFNNQHVDHVQITAAETVGMPSGRGAYYDASGAMRDMVENHLMQILCMVAMEAPSSLTAAAIQDEKVKVLQSVATWTEEDVHAHTVRAQYLEGSVAGSQVPGYREEDRVPPDSETEAYVAMRLAINNWRWAGVPFFLRTGKRLASRVTEIAVCFKRPPLNMFQTVECEGDVCDLTDGQPNVLVFRIQPHESISLHFSSKRPVMSFVVENVYMDFSWQEAWHKPLPEAYERLLLDVMLGDASLFPRSDQVEESWRIVQPMLDAWKKGGDQPMCTYPAGSWGPKEAEALLSDTALHGWRRPVLE